jgi:hypothetical protein
MMLLSRSTEIRAVERGEFEPDRDTHVVVLRYEGKNHKQRIGITVPIRNVGPGLAHFLACSLKTNAGSVEPILMTSFLRSGESTVAWLEAGEEDANYEIAQDAVSAGFVLEIAYEDALEQQQAEESVTIGGREAGRNPPIDGPIGGCRWLAWRTGVSHTQARRLRSEPSEDVTRTLRLKNDSITLDRWPRCGLSSSPSSSVGDQVLRPAHMTTRDTCGGTSMTLHR